MSVSWLSESTTNLGNLISVGKIDPIELTEVYLNAIQNHDFKDKIYSAVTFDRARSESKASSERMKSGMRRNRDVTDPSSSCSPKPLGSSSTSRAAAFFLQDRATQVLHRMKLSHCHLQRRLGKLA